MSQSVAPRTNRRINFRRKAKGNVKPICRKGLLDLGRNLAVGLLDLSETGIRLVLREALPAAQEVSVGLEGPHHRQPLKRAGRVMWCVETAEKTFVVGVQFDKRLPYGEWTRMT